MKLIIGLGNPGKEYQGTRHNVGFDTLRVLSEKWSSETPRSKFESYVSDVAIGPSGSSIRALLVWPQTYMNRSGLAVKQAATFYKTPVEDIIVICDDFHLPAGRLRIRPQGSSGGQNGLKDIANQLGTEDYARLRIGVGPIPAGRNAADFVLGRFATKEKEEIEVVLHDAAAAVACWASQGVAEAMNQFNGVGQE